MDIGECADATRFSGLEGHYTPKISDRLYKKTNQLTVAQFQQMLRSTEHGVVILLVLISNVHAYRRIPETPTYTTIQGGGSRDLSEYFIAELWEKDPALIFSTHDHYDTQDCLNKCTLSGDNDDGVLNSNQEWYLKFKTKCDNEEAREVCVDIDKCAEYTPWEGLHGHYSLENKIENKIDVDACAIMYTRRTPMMSTEIQTVSFTDVRKPQVNVYFVKSGEPGWDNCHTDECINL